MTNIAITGSFASGKSFILNTLELMGYKVFSCDDYVRKLYEDINMQRLIEQTIHGLTKFDKKEIANIIYNDTNEKKKLEAIVFPAVRLGIREFEKDNEKEKIIFTEIPLLFESGFNKHFNYIICVFCNEKIRKERALLRSGISNDIFEKISKAQLPVSIKKSKSDFLINAELEEEEIKRLLIEIIGKIK